jgi:5-keto 4-deoxyuronate isomerase
MRLGMVNDQCVVSGSHSSHSGAGLELNWA